ncbi:hypothetical protein GF312_03880 [Candidatus Poribacteria bacterium]|nr:hypothetical protein [Candidatus Poribacteria bacterium]
MGSFIFEKLSKPVFKFNGYMGYRIKANLQNWLLRAPKANPGMTEMFRLRDRQPKPDLVPWAGEFVGKYLISAIQAIRMIESEELVSLIQQVMADMAGSQAEDGYLGPFTKGERLLGHWDLWGHYHWMLAFMMWHNDTGDKKTLDCVVKAADLVCNIYLNTDKKVLDAGSHEMNMAVIHVLGWIYRETGQERYFQMMQQIEKEWEQAGDYFRQGLDNVEFYKTPLPRWESLHDVQGLVELYQITGDERYKTAFENLWWSIQKYDIHNTGGFTTGEKATGDPYAQGAIETCCTIAWMALSVDMLRLTGDPAVADELELSTWNSMLGSQHPSGRWWTYDTPMNGVRPASAHSIVFQARHGTPELNCCSVNGPRGLGMLSEWAAMTDDNGIVVNYYGPVESIINFGDKQVKLLQETEYPVDGKIKITISPEQTGEFPVRLRIPEWSGNTIFRVNNESTQSAEPRSYAVIEREWKPGDQIELNLDMSLRYEDGKNACEGLVSIYSGPLLMTYDQKFNDFDPDDVSVLKVPQDNIQKIETEALFKPITLLKAEAINNQAVNLCDFASAGAHGTHYRSWLPKS